MTMVVTSTPSNLISKTIKKKRGELRWSELVFQNEKGERFTPKILVPDLPLSTSRHHSLVKSKRNHPLHCDLNDSNGDLSMLSMDEDESSVCHSSVPSATGGAPAERVRPKRRGSLGRFAERLGKRLIGDDDQTVSTATSTTTTSNASVLDGSVAPPPPPPPPACIRADTPQLSNRFSFTSKQRGNATHKKYLGYSESQKKHQLSEERRGQVLSSLYTCMEGDDDEEDLLSNIVTSSTNSRTKSVRHSTINCAAC